MKLLWGAFRNWVLKTCSINLWEQ